MEDTIYGYPLKELMLFAQCCRRQGITEDELHSFCLDAEAIYSFIKEEFDRSIEESLKSYFD